LAAVVADAGLRYRPHRLPTSLTRAAHLGPLPAPLRRCATPRWPREPVLRHLDVDISTPTAWGKTQLECARFLSMVILAPGWPFSRRGSTLAA